MRTRTTCYGLLLAGCTALLTALPYSPATLARLPRLRALLR